MDKKKQLDIIRKRNSQLSEELDKLKFKIEFDMEFNQESFKEAKSLITELEEIKANWLSVIEELEKREMEYSQLIHELKEIKRIMHSMGFKIPWYVKLVNKFKKKDEV